MRPDPAMSGLNHYAYANCNPIMYNDPTGLSWLDDWRQKWEQKQEEHRLQKEQKEREWAERRAREQKEREEEEIKKWKEEYNKFQNNGGDDLFFHVGANVGNINPNDLEDGFHIFSRLKNKFVTDDPSQSPEPRGIFRHDFILIKKGDKYHTYSFYPKPPEDDRKYIGGISYNGPSDALTDKNFSLRKIYLRTSYTNINPDIALNLANRYVAKPPVFTGIYNCMGWAVTMKIRSQFQTMINQ